MGNSAGPNFVPPNIEGRTIRPPSGAPSSEDKPAAQTLKRYDEIGQAFEDLAEEQKAHALGTRKVLQKSGSLREASMETALIASGVSVPQNAESGQQEQSGGSFGGAAFTNNGARIQVVQPEQPGSVAGGVPTKVPPAQAQLIQYMAGTLGILINVLWSQYISADGAPVEVLNLLPGFIAWAILQGSATLYNNRKADTQRAA